MGKNWSGIKIYQYQKIDKLITDKEIDLFEKQIRLVQIVFKLNNKQIDEIPVTDFNERFIPEIDFIFTTKPNNKIPIYFEITERIKCKLSIILFWSLQRVESSIY